MATYFSERSFRFLRSLARHNERAWFHAHKDDYEAHVRQPMLRLIADLREPLRAISPHFRADPKPVGGSLFRIQRDTRFAHDKTPYKTWASARLYHERIKLAAPDQTLQRHGAGIDAPSFYLRIAVDGCFLGGGFWQPDTPTLRRVRDFILANPESWKRAVHAPAFRRRFAFQGESLVRPPRGYPADHPLLPDLMRKSFASTMPLAVETVTGPRLLATVGHGLRGCAPLVDYLCAAMGLEF